jgi:hypothetical protein
MPTSTPCAGASAGATGTASTVGIYSFVLSEATDAAAGKKFAGSMLGVFGGCGESGTERASMTLDQLS